MRRPDRLEKSLPDDPVRALRARELLAETRQLIAAERWKEAAPCAHALVQSAPQLAEGYELMGIAALRTGAARVAEGCFERAVALGPATASRLLHWGKALLALDEAAAAERIFHRALLIRPDDPAILADLGDAQLHQDRHTEALKSFRRLLKRAPDHLYAAHMVAALTTAGQPDRAYVKQLFDDYAGIFDEHLTETLRYRVPQQLIEMIAATGRPISSALDLGCGTGLVASALDNRADAVDGIDLSPAMIEKARLRHLYRHLAIGDCTELLENDTGFAGPYDLIVAADVFIYIGALESIFTALRPRLAPAGLVAFSIETSRAVPIEIRASGRFAHSQDYILGLAEQHDLSILADKPTDIRLEQDTPIPGHLYVLEQR